MHTKNIMKVTFTLSLLRIRKICYLPYGSSLDDLISSIVLPKGVTITQFTIEPANIGEEEDIITDEMPML